MNYPCRGPVSLAGNKRLDCVDKLDGNGLHGVRFWCVASAFAKAWDALPEPYQGAFQRTYQELAVESKVKQASVAGVEKSLAVGREAGMEMVEPARSEIAKAQDIIRPVWKEWLDTAGEDGREGLEILFNAGILEEAWWR